MVEIGEAVDTETIKKHRDLDNYYVAVVVGKEEKGGNFFFADTSETLEEYTNRLESKKIVPMKTALERGYPIQCLNNYDFLFDIACEYREQSEKGKGLS